MKLEIHITGRKPSIKNLSKKLKCEVEIIVDKGDIPTIGPDKGNINKPSQFYIGYVEVHDGTNYKKLFKKLRKLKIKLDKFILNLGEKDSLIEFDIPFLKVLIKNKITLEVNKFINPDNKKKK